eukprot:scaffold52017_cov48-Cyclotella_meneghiniana.AAC.8
MNDPLVFSQICVMIKQEKSPFYKCSDYLSTTQAIDPSHREALFTWGYKTIKTCNGIKRSTAVVAFGYFDRFMSSNTPAAKRALNDIVECQLAFVACLVVALKIHSGFNVNSDFVANQITRDSYDAEEINAMELEILYSLRWKLNGPTPHDFIDYFFEVMPGEDDRLGLVKKLAKALVELAVMRYDNVLHRPSKIAFASLCCAIHHVDISLIDSLQYLEIVSGPLNPHDGRIISLIKSMFRSVREVSHEF